MDVDLNKEMKNRWLLIVVSVVVMMVISIYQNSWSLFAYSMQNELNWNLGTIGLTFTIFAYSSTFVSPFSGMIADGYGPRIVAVLASLLVAAGFLLSSLVVSPGFLYLFFGLGGLGVGILYGVSTATAIKWFPDKRGLVTGIVVFGFGAGTAFFNLIIQSLLETKGIETTFLYLGFFMLVVLLPCSFMYRYPMEGWQKAFAANNKNVKQVANYKPSEMVGTYQWFLIYFSFTFTVSIVLIFGAQMKMLAKEFAIPKGYFNALLVLFPLANGLSRVLSGAVSDRIGREKTMMIFYGMLGITILVLVNLGYNPPLFVATVVFAALLGGSPFALYPATVGDYYGPRYATTNYGITYTAKAWAGLISGWLSGYLVVQFGSYKLPLICVAICSLVAACLSFPKLMKAPTKKTVEG